MENLLLTAVGQQSTTPHAPSKLGGQSQLRRRSLCNRRWHQIERCLDSTAVGARFAEEPWLWKSGQQAVRSSEAPRRSSGTTAYPSEPRALRDDLRRRVSTKLLSSAVVETHGWRRKQALFAPVERLSRGQSELADALPNGR